MSEWSDWYRHLPSEGDLVVIMNPNYRDEILADLEARGLANVRHHSV